MGAIFSLIPAAAAAAAKSLQSCPTPCNPRDGSPPGSPIPGILQARTLEWVAISFCRYRIINYFNKEFFFYYCAPTMLGFGNIKNLKTSSPSKILLGKAN